MRSKSVYVWGSSGPRDLPAVRTLAELLKNIGCEQAIIKACGDKGDVWIQGRQLPAYANAQWSRAWLQPYLDQGLEVTPWSYPWPGQADIDAILTVLGEVWCDEFVLNPETEWRVQSQYSPYGDLKQGNIYAANWVKQLKEQCRDKFGKVPSFGLSSCPSWADFPYEGFAAECDFFLPEHYFPDNEMAPDGESGDEAGEDMVEAHIRRVGRDKPCYVVVTASREYKDGSLVGPYDPYSVIGLAENGLGDMPELAGFSAWEAGNHAFQAEAVRAVYSLLPEPPVEKQDVTPVLQLPYNISDNPAAWHCEKTDKWVTEPAFLGKYQEYGDKALATFGLPITGMVEHEGSLVQYFERARFEKVVEGGEEPVTLGLLAVELFEADRLVDGLETQVAVLLAKIDELLQAPKLPKKIAEALGDLKQTSVAPVAAPDPSEGTPE